MNVILCSGMMRSGSTWSFNAARAVAYIAAESVGLPFAAMYLDGDSLDSFLAERVAVPGVVVIKSHSVTPYALGLAQADQARNICTFRDPRDSVASRQLFKDETLSDSITQVRASVAPMFAFSEETLFVDYQDVMTRPAWAVGRIGDYLSVQLGETYHQVIADELSIEKMDAVSDATSGIDPTYQLHHNHIHGGKIGRWEEELSAGDRSRVCAELSREIDLYETLRANGARHASVSNRSDGGPQEVESGHRYRDRNRLVLGEAQPGGADRARA